MSKLSEAIIFASKAHDGQKRKIVNTPYIFHLMEVGHLVSTMTDNEDVICAGVLHDTIEDTKTTVEDIMNNFGTEVGKLVANETENKRSSLPKDATWKLRKQETIEGIKNDADRNTKIICLSDKLSNLRSMYASYLELGDKVWDYFNQKDPKQHAWYYRELAKALVELDNYQAYKEYVELVEKLFGGYDEK